MRVVKICNTRSNSIPCRVTSVLINMKKLTNQYQATKTTRIKIVRKLYSFMNQENNKTPKESIRDLLHDFVSETRQFWDLGSSVMKTNVSNLPTKILAAVIFVAKNRADVSPYRIYHIKIICLLSYFQLNVANVQ